MIRKMKRPGQDTVGRQPHQSHIPKARGKILPFDQLALDAPLPRAVALSSSPVLERAKRCPGISARPQEPHMATYAPRAQRPTGQPWLQKLTPDPALL
ncbi:hypothetical protein J1605_021107 [Eschrichtius robustus]|uniref:Uncharacterized protein n=1 Tax=Eschrichtius robustus TaxID=9764 RepID=A0AB34HFH8_ESCRO|nr:hypothetical protein J1605_021107 [Eschrichtius robustus]